VTIGSRTPNYNDMCGRRFSHEVASGEVFMSAY